jgi:hypothetical protein
MLLSSLLSSLPAWQLLDPLPVLAHKKGGAEADDDESLESILKKKPQCNDKNQQSNDLSTSVQK